MGVHFWPPSAFIYGIRIDYLSPTIYLLDLLIVLYSVLELSTSGLRNCLKFGAWNLATILPLLLTNLLFSVNPLSTLTWVLRLVLYLIFIRSVTSSLPKLLIAKLLAFVIAFQVSLGAVQVYFGHTLQGPLYWLGERALSLGSPNVAVAAVFNQLTLRPYGTFSHPNILAGWLVVALSLYLTLIRRYTSKASQWQVVIPSVFCVLGVLLSQSRVAALSLFGFLLPTIFFKSRQLLFGYLLLILTATSFFLFSGSFPRSPLSVSDRLILQTTSLQVFQAYPLFGVGAQASLTTYPSVNPALRLLQPDHNSFTLFLSWFGLIGLFAVLLFYRTLRFHLLSFAFYLLPLIPLLSFDHYLLTSPQGLFILILYLSLLRHSK